MNPNDPPDVLVGLREGGQARLRTKGGMVLQALVRPLTARVRAQELDELGERLYTNVPETIAETLARAMFTDLATARRLADRAEVLRYSVTRATQEEGVVLLARHLRVTVEDRWRRIKDEWALQKGQIDLDCLLEREDKLIDQKETRLEVICEAMRGLLRQHDDTLATLRAAGIFATLPEMARTSRRRATRRAATQVLVEAGHAAKRRNIPIDNGILATLDALAHSEDPWVSRDALDIVWAREDGQTWLLELYRKRTQHTDDRLVRARCVELLAQNEAVEPESIREAAATDDSELVKFTLATCLIARGAYRALEVIQDKETAPTVRAWIAGSLAEGPSTLYPLLATSLNGGPLERKHAIAACKRLHRQNTALPPTVRIRLIQLADEGEGAERNAALEALALRTARGNVNQDLVDRLRGLPEGAQTVVTLPAGGTAEELAEALVPAAIDGFGYWLEPKTNGRVKVSRGDQPATGIWRIAHELRNPAPAKRQGARHAIVNQDLGAIRVPPSTLDEASPTEVPGQRVRSARNGSWMPAVPLPDDALDTLRRGNVTLVSAHGVTQMRATQGIAARAWSWVRLSRSFAQYSRLRRESLDAIKEDAQNAYTAALQQLGISIEHRAAKHGDVELHGVDVLTYLLGLGTNTTRHLLGALAVLAAVFYIQAMVQLRKLRKDRATIPLVIGGWGTRGKSGTERLKMGLMTGLGIPTLAKTTGCEAMVLHTPRGRSTEDLYLFRPFDKATIWEQVDVVRLASGLENRVLLWECMALRPAYVDLLQHRWIQDDLSTLTNAYADHEDVMGPSGVDVARTIASFCPDNACLLTTEEPMYPLIEGEAQRRSTTLKQPHLHERELIPADLLERFPYREHPSNIALAAEVAKALGIPRTEAIGLMAEYVVPDLGALVVYPELLVDGRHITFINGMSANDTISFLHSWNAGGMNEDTDNDPLHWKVSVVNNREDRVARSQVFARILVQHTRAHRHVLIGTNLNGLRNWVQEELEKHAQTLAPQASAEERKRFLASAMVLDPGALARTLAAEHRCTGDSLQGFLDVLAATQSVSRGLPTREQLPQTLRLAARAVAEACKNDAVGEALEEATRRWLLATGATQAGVEETKTAYVALFLANVHIVADASSTGDEVIAAIARVAPPRSKMRVFGCQNIKGTGLDFAWQWVWWRHAHLALPGLASDNQTQRIEALARLEALPIRAAAVCDAVHAALAPLVHDPELGRSAQQLQQRLAQRAQELVRARNETRQNNLWTRALLHFERALDPFDAILRRRAARKIFRDLADARISHGAARERLKTLTSRQKGGWIIGRDQKPRTPDLGVNDPEVFG